MRKHLLENVTSSVTAKADNEARSAYARRGASRSMMISIDEMAENAKRMIAGEAIVSLDPSLIDRSFVSDRIDENDDDYASLRDAIKHQGQSSPILVRPHPELEGRYMIVFGHRRMRVARELGIQVLAVVKNFEDITHIITQGQENTARANLSFIEKALFGKKLLEMGQSKDTIKSALTVDDTLLSRMLSVAEIIPSTVIEAVGSAKNVGRDRWEELKKQVVHPSKAEIATQLVKSDEFISKDPVDRFNYLLSKLRSARNTSRNQIHRKVGSSSWTPEDKMVVASYCDTGKTFSLSLKSRNASEFGQFISSNLESLYQAFLETKNCSIEKGGG